MTAGPTCQPVPTSSASSSIESSSATATVVAVAPFVVGVDVSSLPQPSTTPASPRRAMKPSLARMISLPVSRVSRFHALRERLHRTGAQVLFSSS